MNQVIEQTYEEKVKMYKKCTKKEVIKMLLENQRLLDLALNQPVTVNYPYNYPYYLNVGGTLMSTCTCNTAGGVCTCGKTTITSQ